MNSAQLPFISFPIILTILVFFIMIMIPFFIAIKELLRPEDDIPLYIDMFYSKDPMYFGNSFKSIIQNTVERLDSPPPSSIIRLSKKERVEILDSTSLPANSKTKHMLYVKGSFHLHEKAVALKEVYVKGETRLERKSRVRSVYCEKNIHLSYGCEVFRWVCSEKNITANTGNRLGRNVSCNGTLELHSRCRFQSAFALPVVTGESSPNMDFEYPPELYAKREVKWFIHNKFLSINCADTDDWDTGEGRSKLEKQWDFNKRCISLYPGSIVDYNFVARKDLLIRKNCTVYGSYKSYKSIFIEKAAIIFGDIFAEGDIKIDDDCIVMGNVFSQSRVFIGNNVHISKPGTIKSIIGKKFVELGKNTVIYGYVLSEGEGIVK